MSAVVPIATILPLAMATASTMESFASTVRILPLIRTRSGVCAAAIPDPGENQAANSDTQSKCDLTVMTNHHKATDQEYRTKLSEDSLMQ